MLKNLERPPDASPEVLLEADVSLTKTGRNRNADRPPRSTESV